MIVNGINGSVWWENIPRKETGRGSHSSLRRYYPDQVKRSGYLQPLSAPGVRAPAHEEKIGHLQSFCNVNQQGILFINICLRVEIFEKNLVVAGETSLLCDDGIKITQHFQVENIDYLNLTMLDSIGNGMSGENGYAQI
jgi:hypothetical protein